VFLVALFLWQTTFEVTKIDIDGLSRFEPAAVLATVGLKSGSSAGKPEFDAACQRLIATGLFEGCNWKYMPTTRTGVTLTFQLKEAEAGQKVRLSVPGVDDKTLWEWLRTNEPLVQPQMPASDEAIQFYTRAVQRFLRKDVVASVHSNLETRENTLVFRPANAPAITSVKFTGVQAIDAATLEKALSPVAQGTPFTDYDVRQLLDMNVRPMYENMGRLNVSFPSIEADGGAVTVQVDEGRVYTLASAAFAGLPGPPEPKLAVGETAQWNKILMELETGSKALRDKGYLQARYKVDRQLNHQAGTVALNVSYAPGVRFTFNALRLEGLNTPQESNVGALWKLHQGEPMNESYIDEFLRAALGKLGPEFNHVAHQLDPAGETAVDVVITFRRQ
jgi:outer membrane protein insertion porin family